MTMRLPMVDCRSLIEFCQAFDQHKHMTPESKRINKKYTSNYNSNSNSNSNSSSINLLGHPLCKRSPFVVLVLDILMLILVLGCIGFLIIPYINTIYHYSIAILPLVTEVIADLISDAPIAYVIGLIAVFSGVIASIAAWEILELKPRKCGKPDCKGLRNAVEFDIQLESEECIKYLLSKRASGYGVRQLELGKDHKELEVELKKMAPVNGRTVLIFRAPCGCPAGKLEVWWPKRVRRLKK
ncbi:hypothetical protein L1987_04588 [Smallanthus sonchifolius]|uniref:Uncharacterized protein n=1 Tax=Smallanthus sonchifolius TaxID=185202 RepID=A0ACB9JSZ7_9ASTR|nr:hypothetical protein L1987_04588 [Smallanthus sonchifolius]